MTEKSLLELVSNATSNEMVNSFTDNTTAFGEADPYERPSRKMIASHSDEDLAELIAARPSTREAQIASSVIRQREAWRTPARWSLIVSGFALILSFVAFARTL